LDTEYPANNLESPQELARRLNIEFKDQLLLTRALTHRSFFNEHPDAIEDNERLEFLGDAVLDFMVAAWLYHHFPEMPEGDLTRMRSALVHTEQLAEFARQINLSQAMRLGKGEACAGGREKPALLCDTFEALVGAIYLDGGNEKAAKFIFSFLEDAVDDIIKNRKIDDPKSQLQEWAQGQGFPPPQYVTFGEHGPDHLKEFEVEVFVNGVSFGLGSGHSKQSAAKSAAIKALKQLGLSGK